MREVRKIYIFWLTFSAQKMKFSIKDFFSKSDQTHSVMHIWTHFLKKSLKENSIFCAVLVNKFYSPLCRPRGYYFASASYDRTARLWSTDSAQPLRIFAGHLSDVNVRNITFIFTSHSSFSCVNIDQKNVV